MHVMRQPICLLQLPMSLLVPLIKIHKKSNEMNIIKYHHEKD